MRRTGGGVKQEGRKKRGGTAFHGGLPSLNRVCAVGGRSFEVEEKDWLPLRTGFSPWK